MERLESNGGQKKRRDLTEAVFALGAVCVLALVWFQWDAVEIITVFLMPFYWLLIVGFVGAMAVLSIIQAVKRRRTARLFRLFIPPVITATLIFALLFVPFTKLYIELDFSAKIAAREEVVRLIENGEIDLGGKRSGSVALPAKYARLSKGGEVLINVTEDGINVFFFTFSGILDNFSGYVYLAGDSESVIKTFTWGEGDSIKELVKKRAHWYWVSSS